MLCLFMLLDHLFVEVKAICTENVPELVNVPIARLREVSLQVHLLKFRTQARQKNCFDVFVRTRRHGY